MYCIYIFIAFFMIKDTNALSVVGKNITNYFRNELLGKFRKLWEKHRKALENALSTALQDSFGMDGLNVYVKKENDKLCRGYYHDDNLVQIVLSDVDLEDLPRLWKPYVSFSLASNVLKIEAQLSKMNIHADYVLFRNNSDIIKDVKDQNATVTSPFLFEQVESLGKVTITIEHCVLNGFLMVTLSGESVNIGHNFLNISGCLYTVEIYKPGVGGPPVIAKYHPVGEGLTLNKLLMQPIAAEFIPKLQAAIFTLVNTSDIFGNLLTKLRKKQEQIFRRTSEFIAKVVRKLNNITIQENNGALELENKSLTWDDNIERSPNKSNTLTMSEMMLTGLDTLYSAHIGGPYKLSDLKVGEALRFSTIQIRGKVTFESTYGPGNDHYFAVEMNDVEVTVTMDVDTPEGEQIPPEQTEAPPVLKLEAMEVTGIRKMIFSIPGMVFAPLEPTITGYLLTHVPDRILDFIALYFERAIEDARNDKSKDDDGKDKMYYDYSNTGGLYLLGKKTPSADTEMEVDLYRLEDYQRRSRKAKKLSKGKKGKFDKKVRNLPAKGRKGRYVKQTNKEY